MRGREERREGRRGLIGGDLLSLVVLLQELNPVSEKRRKDRNKRITINIHFVSMYLIQPLLTCYYKMLTFKMKFSKKLILAI